MNFTVIVFFSALAGLLCGLLGSGGGIPLLLFLHRALPNTPRTCFSLCVTVMTVFASITLWRYWENGALSLSDAAPFFFPSAVGGIIGAHLLGKIDVGRLRLLFALLCLFGGFRMLTG